MKPIPKGEPHNFKPTPKGKPHTMTPTQQATANVNARNRNNLLAEIVRQVYGNNGSRQRSDIKVTPEGTLAGEVEI